MTRILRIFLCVIGILSFYTTAQAEWCSSLLLGRGVAKVVPIKTASAGGPHTSDTPTIGVSVKNCVLFRSFTREFILKAGESKNDASIFFAQVAVDPDVCNKACVYGTACPDNIKNGVLKQCEQGLASNCDPTLTVAAINTCNTQIGHKPKGSSVGICVYQSKWTTPTMIVKGLWRSFLESLRRLHDAAFYPTIALNQAIRGEPGSETPTGFDLLGCFPVSTSPLPPPFCIKPMIHYPNIDVLRICTDKEQPVRSAVGGILECVVPPPDSNINNTFMNPCVRVTYSKLNSNNAFQRNPDPKYSSLYTANWREILYTHTDVFPKNILIRHASVFDDMTGHIINDPRKLTSPGFNDAQYVDVCGKVDPQTGAISTYPPQTIVDDVNNYRRFELDICTDPITGRDICTTPFDRFSKMNICVKEIRNNGERVMYGCVNRPDMEKPKVSFCDGTLNDKTNSCMKTEIGSVGKYEFKGPMTECTDTQGGDSKNQLCTLQTENPFGFQAILTNRLYVNRITTTAENTNCTFNRLPWRSSYKGGCDNCDIDELGICDKKVVGAERLCLIGYTDVYNSLAKGWCKDDQSDPKNVCNRVCSRVTSNEEPILAVNARVNPINTDQAPLTSSCPYSGPKPDFPYRVRNPVEDDLCVDAYTIEFNKDCKPKEAGANFPAALCNNILSFCSELKPGSTNQYKNFDQCQWIFKECLNSKGSSDDDQRRLDDGTVYTCAQIKQFVSR